MKLTLKDKDFLEKLKVAIPSEIAIGGTMRDLNQISFEEFLETMLSLDVFATESIEEFMQFFFYTCEKCRLAREMFFFSVV